MEILTSEDAIADTFAVSFDASFGSPGWKI